MIVKICGIPSEEIALAARQHGADLLGFVFAESRRKITVSEAAKITKRVTDIAKVGVFANQPLQEVQEIAKVCQLDYVQLHGNESPEYCDAVKRPIIKAFRVGNSGDLARIKDFDVEWLLLDSFVPGQLGGTGIPFDWGAAQEIMSGLKVPTMVAGGLTPGNVAEALRILKPGGVDVSGGVETDGEKDQEKIRRFIRAVRTSEEGDPHAW